MKKRIEPQALVFDNSYVGSKCEVKSQSGEILLIGLVKAITGEHIEIRPAGDRLPLVPYQSVVRMSIYKEGRPPYFGVGKVYVSSSDLLRILDYTDALSFEQRNAFRVTLKTHALVTIDPEDEEPLSDGEMEEREPPKPIEMLLENASLTGFYVISEIDLQIGQSGRLNAKLEHVDFVLDFFIIRKVDEGEGLYGYGCSFKDVSLQVMDKFCSILFRKQGAQIRRAKNQL